MKKKHAHFFQSADDDAGEALTEKYIERKKFGLDMDSDSEYSDDAVSPASRRRARDDEVIKNAKKLEPCATFISLIKAFLGTSYLFMTKGFVNGGWLFTSLMMLFSCCLTAICARNILKVREATGLRSYQEMGQALFGKHGRFWAELALGFSQASFCCSLVYFLKENLHQVLKEAFGVSIRTEVIAVGWYVLLVGLALVRRLEMFAKFHAFAIFAVVVGTVTIVYIGSQKLVDRGPRLSTVYFLNPYSWYDGVGISVYQFEGLGVVFPVQDVTRNPEQYQKIVGLVLGTVGVTFILFSLFCVCAWGDELQTPLITDQLGPGVVFWLVKILLMMNVVASFPLQLFPANLLVEGYLFKGWPKSRKRQTCKNVSRIAVVTAVFAVTILLEHRLDQFVSLVGSLSCAPMAFILPALFHLRATKGSSTQFERWVDISIAALGFAIMIFCTGLCLINWNR